MHSAARRSARVAGVVVSAMLVGLVGLSPAQAAAPVVCGATLTVDTTLTQNVTCANGQGLTLAAGVTLDLGGFKLYGPTGSTRSGTGVTLSEDGGNIVKNGTIVRWAQGVYVYGGGAGEGSTLEKVTVDRAPVGADNQSLTITNSTFVDSPVSFSFGGITSSGSTFTRSSIGGYYMRSSLTGAKITGGNVQADVGTIEIRNSTLDGTGFAGPIGTCNESNLYIYDSTVRNYAQPISGPCEVILERSTVTNNKGGVVKDLLGGWKWEVNNTFTDNVFVGNGITLETGAMNVTGNQFIANTTGLVATDPQNTTITGNTFTRNTSSGVRALTPGLTLQNNVATNNGRYGLYAVDAVDLGGNRASGNVLGDCVGLTCTAP